MTLYSCVTGGYDELIEDGRVNVVSKVGGLDNNRTAKHAKMFPHLYIDDEVSVWIDGNVRLKRPVEDIVDKFLEGGRYDWGVLKHTSRDCLYDEAVVCMRNGFGNEDEIYRQVMEYGEEGMPEHWGLYENPVIVRRHNEAWVKELEERWWEEVMKHSVRDQISFPYLIWKMGLKDKIHTVEIDIHGDNEYFIRTVHK